MDVRITGAAAWVLKRRGVCLYIWLSSESDL
jgi:hypothetical protein